VVQAPPAAKPAPAQAAPQEAHKAPQKPEWGFLAKGTERSQTAASKPEEPSAASKGSHLIDAAVWAKPVKKERTLYRTQVLPCEVLQKIDSDAPGQIQLRLTVPVYGYYGQGDELFPKDSKIVAMPEGKPDYGDRTLAVKLDQAHLPDGTIVEIPGNLGNEDGSSGGLKGKVNNHWDKVFLSAAANALVSLGGGYLAGTPGRNQFYQDPAQRSLEEASRSIQQDTKSVIGRELKRGPTITRDPSRKGERFCTIQMLKNIQFGATPPIIK
jgi:type IV secretory pathway VirB10-like protein